MIYLLLSLTFISSSVLAANCRLHNGRTFVTIPDGKKVSLFEAGKPLEDHRMQDQDGLGTCYANTSSVVMKTLLPGAPDISYTHAALESSTNGWRKNWSNGGSYVQRDKGNVRDLTEGGHVCETIAAMKKAGGACPRRFAILENKDYVNPSVQQRIFDNLGVYFDELNTLKDSPGEFNQLKSDLARIIDSINMERSALLQRCEEEKQKELPLHYAVSDLLSSEILYAEEETTCDKLKKEALIALMGPGSVVNSDSVIVKPSPEILAKFERFFNQDPALKARVLEEIGKEHFELKKEDPLTQQLGQELFEILAAEVQSRLPQGQCTGEEDAYTPSIDAEFVGVSFTAMMFSQKASACENFLNDRELVNDVRRSENNQCIAPTRLEKLMDAIKPLMELGEEIDANLLAGLTNTIAEGGNQLKDLLVPGCQDKSNLVPMDDVSCATFTMCDMSRYRDYENYEYSGPEGGCYDMDRARSEMRLRVFNAITDNRAVGVNVCTQFLKDGTTASGFCTGGSYSYHAMAVSGYKCEGGKIKYEIVNSWGRQCPRGASAENSAIECEKDEYNWPTGKFWVKEDTLVDNTTGIVQITRRGR